MTLRALDTWWFREGRLFEQMDEGLAEAESLFPPPPSTLSGALAVALARANTNSTTDIAGQNWGNLAKEHPILADLSGLTGNGGGAIRLTGPFLVCDGELFVPMPMSLALNEESKARILLPKRAPGHVSDFGDRPFLIQQKNVGAVDADEYEPTTDCWLRWNEFVSHALDVERDDDRTIDTSACGSRHRRPF